MRGAQRSALALLAALAAAVAFGACSSEPDQPEAASSPAAPMAELGGELAPITGPGYRSIARVNPSASPEGTSLIVGHVQFASRRQAADARLRLRSGGETVRRAGEGLIEPGAGAARTLACLCRVPADAGVMELQVRGGGALHVTGRSLVVVEGVEQSAPAAPSLPDPLVAATVSGSPGEITADAQELVRAMPAGGAAPLLVVGVVRAEAAAELEAIGVNAWIGSEELVERGTFSRLGGFVGLYTGDGEAGSEVTLQSATGSGGAELATAAIFACACELSEERALF